MNQRSYRMGFANSVPRYDDFNLVIETLNIWTTRADAAIISDQVPWDSIYAGVTPQNYVINNYLGLVNYYRGLGLKLWVYIDPENGLNRAADADDLAAMGKSIADADAQSIYRRYVFVMDSILKPDHLGLALETNLIRDLASSSIYNGVKQAVNSAAIDVRAYDKTVKLSVSVQVDDAWGKILNDSYKGIDKDLNDFPFVEELGLSSYPYFVFDNPSNIPIDYYSKLVEGKNIPVFISEGGWSSTPIIVSGKTTSGSLEIQKEYISYQHQLLSKVNAIGYFQLTFTDIDVAALPPSVPSSISYFASLGMVDVNLQRKPALDTWDNLFQKQLH
ncbi:MAG: hypothetical protein QM734_04105 [Cyclobacteriaceae bacterium]